MKKNNPESTESKSTDRQEDVKRSEVSFRLALEASERLRNYVESRLKPVHHPNTKPS